MYTNNQSYPRIRICISPNHLGGQCIGCPLHNPLAPPASATGTSRPGSIVAPTPSRTPLSCLPCSEFAVPPMSWGSRPLLVLLEWIGPSLYSHLIPPPPHFLFRDGRGLHRAGQRRAPPRHLLRPHHQEHHAHDHLVHFVSGIFPPYREHRLIAHVAHDSHPS